MARLTGIKCFSILVASGHGDRCGALRIFRRILDMAMSQGRWAGQMGLPS